MDPSDYWQRRRGATLRQGRVWSLPDEPAAEAAAAPAAALVPLLRTGPLRVRGEDRLAFLHGQLSHDVQGLPRLGARRMLQLTVRGQVAAEAVVVRRDEDVFLAVEDGAVEAVRASLDAHVVFDQVELTPLAGRLACLSVQGPGAASCVEGVLGAAPQGEAALELPWQGARVLALRRARGAEGGVDLHLLGEAVAGLVEALEGAGAQLRGERWLTRERVRAGLPSARWDAGAGVLPQEAGLEPLVSYRKGCYLGQEIMARIEARGRLHRALARVRLAMDAATCDAWADDDGREVRAGGRVVGRLGSVAWDGDAGAMGLAVLRRDLGPGDGVEVAGVRGEVAGFVASRGA